MLTDEEQRLLTDARTLKWRLEHCEYAYDSSIRGIHKRQVLNEFLGVAVALSFLVAQYLTKGNLTTVHDGLGYIATVLSVGLILLTFWGAASRWHEQVKKKQQLSTRARELITEYGNLVAERPVNQKKVQRWKTACSEFEGERKDPLASVSDRCWQDGFRHVGSLYGHQGDIKCGKCGKAWTPDTNKRMIWRHWPRQICEHCGVRKE